MSLREESGRYSEADPAVPETENATLSVVCRNDLDMAAACAFHCARAGAARVKVSVNGAVYPSLRAVAKSIQTRGDNCGICCGNTATLPEPTALPPLDFTPDKLPEFSRDSQRRRFLLGISSPGLMARRLWAHPLYGSRSGTPWDEV